MLKYLLTKMSASIEVEHGAREKMSRRNFLFGACTVIGTACISSSIGVTDASATPLATAPLVEEGNGLVELAQALRKDKRRRDDRGGRRVNRRDLERQCKRSKKFRRNNRGLCKQVTGRTFGSRGSCIQLGPLQICE